MEFVSDRMSYIILKCGWWNTVVLNVHGACEDKGDDVKDSLYEELGRVLDQFPRYDMNILLNDFQFESRQGRYFQTDSLEREFAWNY
jgi:hypothetical protein